MDTTNTRVRPLPETATEASRVYLMEIAGKHVGALHKIEGERTVLGRGEGAGIRLGDEGVSREHAEILLEGGRVLVRDLSSTNGTFVNGARQTTHELRDGDQVSVGTATFVVFSHADGIDAAFPRGRAASSSFEAAPTSARREAFLQRLAEEVSFARRHGVPAAVIAWELDEPAALVARLEPASLASVLASVREAAFAALPPGDTVWSIGPGRFLSLCRQATAGEARELARAIRDAVSATARDARGASFAITAHLGVATLPAGSGKPADAARAMVRAAETALAEARGRADGVAESP
jgi:two-component system cell cycle response regulator